MSVEVGQTWIHRRWGIRVTVEKVTPKVIHARWGGGLERERVSLWFQRYHPAPAPAGTSVTLTTPE